eukprot:SM000037S13594  [mRNA]  locus=s37:879209:883284:- [translate_table: standard]
MAPRPAAPAALALACALAAALLLPPAPGARAASIIPLPRQCVSSFSAGTDYFPQAYKGVPWALPLGQESVNTALDFTVQYNRSYKLVRNNFADATYVLYQCGTPKPAGFPAGTRILEIPLTTTAIDTTVPVAFMELLGLFGAATEVDMTYVNSPCLQKLYEKGQVVLLASPYENASLFASQASAVDAILDSTQTPSNITNFISFDASTDPGPLKRAEWIKFLALFFNREALATEVYDKVQTSYNCLNGSMSNISAKPTVAWLSYFDLTSDAGGVNLPRASYGDYNMSIDAEQKAFLDVIKTADVVIDETYSDDPAAYTISNVTSNAKIALRQESSYPFLANKRVWREDRRMNANAGLGEWLRCTARTGRGYDAHQTGLHQPRMLAQAKLFVEVFHQIIQSGTADWYEGALAEPQVVLQELIAILHMKNLKHTYLRNIAENNTVVVTSASQCTGSPLTAKEPVVIACPISTSPPAGAPTPAASHAMPPPPSGGAPLHRVTVASMSWVAVAGACLALTM